MISGLYGNQTEPQRQERLQGVSRDILNEMDLMKSEYLMK